MAAAIPTSLKLVTSAVRRAEELEKDTAYEAKVVSYYCRFYVVSKGSKLCSNPTTPDETKFLISQMEILEKLKPTLELTQEKGRQICKTYANSVFEKADDEDRAGVADKATAKMFYAAGTFFDILETFGDMENELLEKRKYSKWKATDILNAIKNGEKPTAGGFREGIADLALAGDSNDAGTIGGDVPYTIPAPPSVPPSAALATHIPTAPFAGTPPVSPLPYLGSSSVVAPTPVSLAATASATIQLATSNFHQYYATAPALPPYYGPPVSNNDPRVKDTMELCSFAIAALKKNEIEIARERLREALRRLD